MGLLLNAISGTLLIFFIVKNADYLIQWVMKDVVTAYKGAVYTMIIPIISTAIDPELVRTYLILCIPMLLGIMARFGSLYKKKLLNKRNVITQLLVTLPFCVVAYWIWDFYKIDFPIHLIIAGVSYFSITIVSIEADTGELTLRAWLYKVTGGFADFIKPKNND